MSHRSRLKVAIELCQEVGQIALAHFKDLSQFELKTDQSPVTVADRLIEEQIRLRLGEIFPDDEILGEETGGALKASKRWVIDPIDGTKSFLAGVPLFATLVGFELEGVPVLGVAHFPALDETFWASSGTPAYRNGNEIRVSNESKPERSIICTGSPASLDRAGLTAPVLQLAEQCMAVRTWGDAFGHMMVASGRAQAMIDPKVSRWDVAAIIPILRAAGASISDIKGNDPIASDQLENLELVSVSPSFEPFLREVLS